MKTLQEIERLLKAYKPNVQQQYHVTELGIFGSYVRGEQTEDSDVDVLVDFAKTPTLFDLVGLENELSEIVGIKVDLVHKPSLRPHLRQSVLAELISV
jgi:hypothetical protein